MRHKGMGACGRGHLIFYLGDTRALSAPHISAACQICPALRQATALCISFSVWRHMSPLFFAPSPYLLSPRRPAGARVWRRVNVQTVSLTSPLLLLPSPPPTTTVLAMGVSQPVKDVLSGTAGGISQVFVGQPFDIVKVRLQTAPEGTYKSALPIH